MLVGIREDECLYAQVALPNDNDCEKCSNLNPKMRVSESRTSPRDRVGGEQD